MGDHSCIVCEALGRAASLPDPQTTLFLASHLDDTLTGRSASESAARALDLTSSSSVGAATRERVSFFVIQASERLLVEQPLDRWEG
jgi:hypothetical protein